MPQYFNINYEFSPTEVWHRIDQSISDNKSDYICVADGNILQMVHRDLAYREVINSSMFSICDSGHVPNYLKKIYGLEVPQYCGSQIFEDGVKSKQYKMTFLGTTDEVLSALRNNLANKYDPAIADMQFVQLPYRRVEEFDYEAIAAQINEYAPDIIWVALGAPKQEIFMSKLKPHIKRGVQIGVGAVFKFYSGVGEKRAPNWMIKARMEFVYRLFSEPKKQFKRCSEIVRTLPSIIREEKKKSKYQ